MKKCGKCKIEKNEDNFSKCQFKRSGGICRECNTKILAEYRNKNSDKIKEYQKNYDQKYYSENKKSILENKKQYYSENKEFISEKGKEYYVNNKEKIKEYHDSYYENNKNDIINKNKEYYVNNKEEIKKYHNLYYKNKRNTDLNFRIKTNISANIYFYLKSNGLSKNKKSTLKYIQYTIDDLKEHLEKQFESWMTWENYGKYYAKIWDNNDQSTWTWQIDHIMSHSSFNYTSMDEQAFKDCWALSNLRPFSAKQNLLDGNRKI